MGQIKNIKLHIVTDIKIKSWLSTSHLHALQPRARRATSTRTYTSSSYNTDSQRPRNNSKRRLRRDVVRFRRDTTSSRYFKYIKIRRAMEPVLLWRMHPLLR